MVTGESEEERLEALIRTVDEIDVLQAIYGCSDEEKEGDFKVLSDENLLKARRCIEAGFFEGEAPQIDIELRIDVANGQESNPLSARMRCTLPPGYPHVCAVVSIISADGLRRKERDHLSTHLASRAMSLIGTEAIMILRQELQDAFEEQSVVVNSGGATVLDDSHSSETEDSSSERLFGRRWIWVHHITDSSRRKDIVREARDFRLGGFLKAGYPGIIVVEGKQEACDEFVTWIKGNKSMPGGFGRNWGHHVRGEINTASDRQLPESFEELEEDMGVLATRCKEAGLESEFLAYVMQH